MDIIFMLVFFFGLEYVFMDTKSTRNFLEFS